MKRIILLSLLSALLAGCVVVPLGYDDGRGHGYYRGDGYYHGYYGYRGYSNSYYRDHGQ
jgi:hypothetical protein